jgi:hypothetical protein
VLSESSYLTAIYAYTGAACLAILALGWWFRRSLRPAWLVFLMLLAAALLLTPAFPRTDVSTMAPALVVAAFALFTDGYDAAEHALRPLGMMCLLGAGIALLARVTVFKGRSSKPASVDSTAGNG